MPRPVRTHDPERPRPDRRTWLCAALLGALAPTLSAQTPARAPGVKVLTAGAFKQVVLAVVPAFEAGSGLKAEIDNDTAGALVKRVQAGEAFDVLIVPPAAMQTLTAAGKVEAASVHPLARVAIGVAVKSGQALPPLDTVEQFKDAVTRARKVAYIDPASGGSSGIYLSGLFERLGIADLVRSKAVLVKGGLVAERVANGEADLAIHQVSEILPVAGVTLAGVLPDSIQNYTTYAVGAASGARSAAAAALIEALGSAQAAEIIRQKGMTPLR